MRDADRGRAQHLPAGGPVAVEAGPVPGGAGPIHRAGERLAGRLVDHACGRKARLGLELLHRSLSRRLEGLLHAHAAGVALRLHDPVQDLDVGALHADPQHARAEGRARVRGRNGRRSRVVASGRAAAGADAAAGRVGGRRRHGKREHGQQHRPQRKPIRALLARARRLPIEVVTRSPIAGIASIHSLFLSAYGVS